MTIVYLAIGTNMGNRMVNIRSAIDQLKHQFSIVSTSSVYETPPWGFTEQQQFLNMALSIECNMHPVKLLIVLKKIETELGREKTFQWGPRLIDIDIIYYGEKIYELQNLNIPHKEMHKRGFVMVPISEIAPDFIHPIIRKKNRVICDGLDTEGIIKYHEQI